MRARLEQRLEALKSEFEAGQKMLAELEQQRVNLEQKLLRISGAIQVLAELKAEDSGETGDEESRPADTAEPA